jgi:hypothetical protein
LRSARDFKIANRQWFYSLRGKRLYQRLRPRKKLRLAPPRRSPKLALRDDGVPRFANEQDDGDLHRGRTTIVVVPPEIWRQTEPCV